MYANLRASEALIDLTNRKISDLAHAPRESLTPEQRAQIAVEVATAKVSIVDHGLHLTSKVFELTGARATSSSVGLDRFWRNLRVHSLQFVSSFVIHERNTDAVVIQSPTRKLKSVDTCSTGLQVSHNRRGTPKRTSNKFSSEVRWGLLLDYSISVDLSSGYAFYTAHRPSATHTYPHPHPCPR